MGVWSDGEERQGGDAVERMPRESQSGVVGFLLTAIDGSSGLWEEHPAAMAAALPRHDELVADRVGLRRGVPADYVACRCSVWVGELARVLPRLGQRMPNLTPQCMANATPSGIGRSKRGTSSGTARCVS